MCGVPVAAHGSGDGLVSGDLSARYGREFGLAAGAFWADRLPLVEAGLIEQVCAPFEGQPAVYRVCVRLDRLPRDLPADLAAALGLEDLSDVLAAAAEALETAAAARRGHLADVPEGLPEWTVVSAAEVPRKLAPVKEPSAGEEADETALRALAEQLAGSEFARLLGALAADARWEHPQGSRAAQVAADIARAAAVTPQELRPADPRCVCIAPAHRLRTGTVSYTRKRALSPFGLFTQETLGPVIERMESAERTPQRAAGAWRGDGPSAVAAAEGVLGRAYAIWRDKLRSDQLIYRPAPGSAVCDEERARPWRDLRHAVVVALRRSTEDQLVAELTHDLHGVRDVARLAAGRCWTLTRARRVHTAMPDAAARPRRAPQIPNPAPACVADEAGSRHQEFQTRRMLAAAARFEADQAGAAAVRSEVRPTDLPTPREAPAPSGESIDERAGRIAGRVGIPAPPPAPAAPGVREIRLNAAQQRGRATQAAASSASASPRSRPATATRPRTARSRTAPGDRRPCL